MVKRLLLKEFLSVFGSEYQADNFQLKLYRFYKGGVIYAQKIDGKFVPDSPAFFLGRIQEIMLVGSSRVCDRPDGLYHQFSYGIDCHNSCRSWFETEINPYYWLLESLSPGVRFIEVDGDDIENLKSDYFDYVSPSDLLASWVRWFCFARSLDNHPSFSGLISSDVPRGRSEKF